MTWAKGFHTLPGQAGGALSGRGGRRLSSLLTHLEFRYNESLHALFPGVSLFFG